MTTVYRLCSLKYPASSGAGAALHGGRWNSPGVEVIYASTTVALAVLEIVVNFSVLPKGYGLTRISIPDDVKITEPFATLKRFPNGWDDPVPTIRTQQLGTAWIRGNASPVLLVPSAVVPHEKNYVLNPNHLDFHKIAFSQPEPFHFDPRLFK